MTPIEPKDAAAYRLWGRFLPGLLVGVLMSATTPEAPWWHFGVAGVMAGIAWDLTKRLTGPE